MEAPHKLVPQHLNLPVTHGVLDFIDPNFFKDDKPYTIAGPLPAEQESARTNLVTAPCPVPLRDVRNHMGLLSLEKNGFAIVTQKPSCALDTISDDSVHGLLRENTEWLRQQLNADHCFCYAYKFRNSAREPRSPGTYSGTRGTPDEPAPLPHVDHTKDGGPNRIRRHLTADEQALYLTGDFRLRIITIWRPINGPVQDFPLAFCNAFSVDEQVDLIPGDRITSQHVGEVYYIGYNERQDWYWLSNQTPDEMTVFVSYDSHQGIGPAFIPHGTFRLEGTDDHRRPRESLEARFIVIG